MRGKDVPAPAPSSAIGRVVLARKGRGRGKKTDRTHSLLHHSPRRLHIEGHHTEKAAGGDVVYGVLETYENVRSRIHGLESVTAPTLMVIVVYQCDVVFVCFFPLTYIWTSALLFIPFGTGSNTPREGCDVQCRPARKQHLCISAKLKAHTRSTVSIIYLVLELCT